MSYFINDGNYENGVVWDTHGCHTTQKESNTKIYIHVWREKYLQNNGTATDIPDQLFSCKKAQMIYAGCTLRDKIRETQKNLPKIIPIAHIYFKLKVKMLYGRLQYKYEIFSPFQ